MIIGDVIDLLGGERDAARAIGHARLLGSDQPTSQGLHRPETAVEALEKWGLFVPLSIGGRDEHSLEALTAVELNHEQTIEEMHEWRFEPRDIQHPLLCGKKAARLGNTIPRIAKSRHPSLKNHLNSDGNVFSPLAVIEIALLVKDYNVFIFHQLNERLRFEP